MLLSAWNIRGLGQKEPEIINAFEHQNTKNIAVIIETKKKQKGTKDVVDWAVIDSGVKKTERVQVEIMRMRGKVTLRIQIQRGILTIICVYAPEEGRKENTQLCYDMLQKEVNKFKIRDHLLIARNLNACVGNLPVPNVGYFQRKCNE